MSSWHQYSGSFNIGHKALTELFDGPVVIEEKVDGSQFSFGMIEDAEGHPVLRMRSKGKEIDPANPEKMFALGIQLALSRMGDLRVGWTYRGEFLSKPKHNTLAYDRAPALNFILWDIAIEEENYLNPRDKLREAQRLGLECVPCFFEGNMTPNLEELKQYLTLTSVLGGQKIEGITIKNYSKFGPDKKILFAKLVSEQFKEIHSKDWKDRNPKQGDVIELLGQSLRTPARWEKAIQHLRDNGSLKGELSDIGPLMRELSTDLEKEVMDEIKEQLFKQAWPNIKKIAVRGFPEWYKEKLAKEQLG